MRHHSFILAATLLSLLTASPKAYDLSTTKVQYVIAYAHLDAQWLWDWGASSTQYIPSTINQNFAYIQQYPNYVFSFEGAWRYMYMKQNLPTQYAQIKQYVAQGKWVPSGFGIEDMDVNLPSPESLIRQFLYSGIFFQDEFNRVPQEILAPDIFGMSYALPSAAAHCGIKGVVCNMERPWAEADVIPFSIGRWQGPDGHSIIACLKPGNYQGGLDIHTSDMDQTGSQYGIYAAYDICGIGDQGGSPSASDVSAMMTRISQNSSNDIKVVLAPSDQIFRDITDAQAANLPAYQGEIQLRTHGHGAYTTKGLMKWYNRKIEQLGAAAECASVIAERYAQIAYPKARIKDDWIRFLWHQFHDDVTGTSIPDAYNKYSLPDCRAVMTDFNAVLSGALDGISSAMDCSGTGTPLVVFNPLGIEREDVVDTVVAFSTGVPTAVRVYDGAGNEVPSQMTTVDGTHARLVFVAQVPSAGAAVFYARQAASPCAINTGVGATASQMENSRYRVTINAGGDISSVYDKDLGRELLSAPMRLALFNDRNENWPAWEISYDDLYPGPKGYVQGTPTILVEEHGPARASVSIVRTADGSTFTQHIRLGALGSGDIVEVQTDIDWQTRLELVKAAFPFTAANNACSYDIGLGTISRPISNSHMWEYCGQQFADLTDNGGSFGVSVVNDSRYGWDQPDQNTLRLTLVRNPNGKNMGWADFTYQGSTDIGQHTMRYGVYAHRGSLVAGQSVHAAARFNQPLVCHQTSNGTGTNGSSISLVKLSRNAVVMGIKKAELTNDIVLRYREIANTVGSVTAGFDGNITGCREITGREIDKGAVSASGSILTANVVGFEPKSYALTLGAVVAPPSGSFSSIVLTPAFAVVPPQDSATFRAVAIDEYGEPLVPQPVFNWQVGDGQTITANGVFKAGASQGGPYTVTVSASAGQSTKSATARTLVVDARPGVIYRYIANCWTDLRSADLTHKTASDSGLISTFSIAPATATQGFSFQFLGVLLITTPGTYTIYTKSDDGSLVYIGDSLVADNHTGSYPSRMASGAITLGAGVYPIRVEYSQLWDGSKELQVSYSGPGIAKQEIPPGVLFHTGGGDLPVINSANSSMIAPRPAIDMLKSRAGLIIDIAQTGGHTVQLFSIQGRLLRSIKGEGPHEYLFSSNEFTSGAVIAKVKATGLTKTMKLTVSR